MSGWLGLPAQQREHYAQILTPIQLDVVRHRINGHSYRTIGMALHRDEATIRGHYRRALERIGKHMTQEAA